MSVQSESELLSKIPMFRDIDMAKLRLLALSGRRITYRAGEVVFRENDQPDAVYVLLDGRVDIIREAAGGAGRVPLGQLETGTIFGETAVLCDRPRTATIEASTDVTVIQIDRQTFTDVVRDVPQLALAIARELALRLERMSERFATQPKDREQG
ncbi:MAG TPA: cyclic nucleotide-binding domain-containing protein [Hyphomicrobiaceae bacterium]|nr:cyclic nucleotide-binding domain-containing protein [Hyphomicrobiaceae bacterium]